MLSGNSRGGKSWLGRAMKEKLEELGAKKIRDEVLSGAHYECYEYEGKKYLFVKKDMHKENPQVF